MQLLATEVWSTRILGALRVVVLVLIGYGILVFLVQRRVAFPGTFRDSARPAPSSPSGVRQVWLETTFGRVEAWLVMAGEGGVANGAGGGTAEGASGGIGGVSEAGTPTLVFAHGNGELIEDWRQEMERLARRGVSVLLVEYPGYGHSDGKPSRATIQETFERAFDWLVDEGGVAPDRIVAYGRSLGGGAATDLTRTRPVAALILQSTFSTAAAMAREMLVPGFLVRDRFDNESVVASFGGPVLLMHGPADDVISFRHAERLAEARKGLQITEIDCAHNDCLSEWPAIMDHVISFLERSGLIDDGGTEPETPAGPETPE